jgi:hypothetical protein
MCEGVYKLKQYYSEPTPVVYIILSDVLINRSLPYYLNKISSAIENTQILISTQLRNSALPSGFESGEYFFFWLFWLL